MLGTNIICYDTSQTWTLTWLKTYERRLLCSGNSAGASSPITRIGWVDYCTTEHNASPFSNHNRYDSGEEMFRKREYCGSFTINIKSWPENGTVAALQLDVASVEEKILTENFDPLGLEDFRRWLAVSFHKHLNWF